MKTFKLFIIAVFLLLFAGTAAQADMSHGLVSYYPFEGDSNDVISGHDGISEGEVIYGEGALGLGARFGGDGEVIVEMAPGLTEWTISLWVYIDTPPLPNYTYCILGKLPQDNGDDSDFSNYGFYYTYNRFPHWQYQTCDTGEDHMLKSVTPLNPHSWYHITSTFDATGSHKFFINGMLRNQLFNQGDPCANDAPMTIGGMAGLFSQMFKGMVDELRVYDRALDQSEVAEVYSHDEIYVLSNPEPECPEPDFFALMDGEADRLGLDYGSTGAVHVYPNLLKPNWKGNHMRTVVLEGHIANKLSALKYDTPDVIRSAFVLIDGERYDIVLNHALGFEQAVEIPAIPGTELLVALIALDVEGNASLVDRTHIRVSGHHPCERLEKLENRVAELQAEKVKLKKKVRWYHRIKTARIDKKISWLNRKIVKAGRFCESLN